jgi:ABC-type transport system involved in cytochrome c biogenesis permease subunit
MNFLGSVSSSSGCPAGSLSTISRYSSSDKQIVYHLWSIVFALQNALLNNHVTLVIDHRIEFLGGHAKQIAYFIR